MRKLEINIDLDGIVTDFYSHLRSRFRQQFGREYPEGVHFPDKMKNPELFADHSAITCSPGFYLTMPPIQGALAAVEHLYRLKHSIHIVTSPHSKFPPSAAEKIEWCKMYLPFLPHKNVTLTSSKHRVLGDVLVDDLPSNLDATRLMQPAAKLVTVDYPYNAKTKVDCRAHLPEPWKEIIKFIAHVADES